MADELYCKFYVDAREGVDEVRGALSGDLVGRRTVRSGGVEFDVLRNDNMRSSPVSEQSAFLLFPVLVECHGKGDLEPFVVALQNAIRTLRRRWTTVPSGDAEERLD